jgi:hypothetical protein
VEKRDSVVADRLNVSKELKQQNRIVITEEFTFEWPERIPCCLYLARHLDRL